MSPVAGHLYTKTFSDNKASNGHIKKNLTKNMTISSNPTEIVIVRVFL